MHYSFYSNALKPNSLQKWTGIWLKHVFKLKIDKNFVLTSEDLRSVNYVLCYERLLIEPYILCINPFTTNVPIIKKPVCSANQWTDFYMIGISVMNELKDIKCLYIYGNLRSAFRTQSNV